MEEATLLAQTVWLISGNVQVFKAVLDKPLNELMRHFLLWLLAGIAGALTFGALIGWDFDYLVQGALLGVATSGNISLTKEMLSKLGRPSPSSK